jgi:hypothetical protein
MFKQQVEELIVKQKELRLKTQSEIQLKEALQKQTKNKMVSDFNRQTIESSPQAIHQITLDTSQKEEEKSHT